MNSMLNISASDFEDFPARPEETRRPTGNPGDFRWNGDRLVHVGVESVNCSSLNILGHGKFESFKEHFIEFTLERNYSAPVLLKAAATIAATAANSQFSSFDEAWAMRSLESKSFIRNKGPIKTFLIYWNDRCPFVVSSEALRILANAKISVKSSRNVLSDDPEKGWLTDFEFDAVVSRVWENFDRGIFGVQTTLLRLLAMQYARRPIQYANLKIGDFKEGSRQSGVLGGRVISFPGAKDRQAEKNFRDSKVEIHPVADHLWDLFQLQKEYVREMFSNLLRVNLSENELELLPVFAFTGQLKIAVDELTDHFSLKWQEHLSSRLFHCPAWRLGKFISWSLNDPIRCASQEESHLLSPPLSHRTGDPISITGTRLRHTRARQLARLGMPKHVLGFWLGHTVEQSLDAYYNDPAEEARHIDDAMRSSLTSIAMSFTGKLLDNERQATRATDPESSLEFSDGESLRNVGMCGKHSFCSTTTVPIPCYRCKYFEPLVYGPHEEVLTALLVRQAQEQDLIRIGGSRRLVEPIDLSSDIRAVQACISRCEIRKVELGGKRE